MTKKFAFIFLFLLSGNVLAAGWLTQDATIDAINVEGGLVKVVFTGSSISDPDNCGNPGVAILQDDTKNGDRQFALLLSAKMSDKKVKLYSLGCLSGWGQTWAKVYAVFIE